MPAPVSPRLRAGKVYRTKYFERYGKNAPRIVKRLVSEGQLNALAHGLFVCPETSKFGAVPPSREALMRGYLKGKPFIFSGPEEWNALGLGSTAMFSAQLVYNRARTCEVELGGRRFLLRRVAFPERPSAEYYAIDLIKNHRQAGVSLETIGPNLSRAIAEGRLSGSKLRHEAKRFGTRASSTLVEEAVAAAA